jgi:trk system potassium uptake protein TrkH
MADAFSSLVQPVRWRVLGKYLGQLALALAVLVVPPLGVAAAAGEHLVAFRHLLVLALLCALGWPLSRLAAPDRIQGNEATAIVTLAFVLASLLMAYPMAAAGLSYVDALFEAVSGITTTGLTTVARVADKPPAFLFTRAWMQWYGGLGIAVLVVALARQGVVARKLVESAGTEILVSTGRAHARRVLAVYAVLTLGAFLLIWGAGLAPAAALEQALAAVSTGGFATFDNSLGGSLPPLAPYAVMLAALLGAVSLPTLYTAARRGPAALWADYELRALLGACAVVGALLALWFALHGMGLLAALHHGFLLGVSAQSTAGFSTLPVASLDGLSKALLILAMAVGGSEGSTAGGVKLFRLLILMRLVQLAARRASLPEHAVIESRLGGRALDDAEIVRALLVMALFWGLVLLSWLAFLAYSYRPLDALFEVVSATATVGLSSGVTSHDLATPLKLLLCVDMLAGRLEIMALLIVLYPPTWFGRR